jgi:hypothetical protein
MTLLFFVSGTIAASQPGQSLGTTDLTLHPMPHEVDVLTSAMPVPHPLQERDKEDPLVTMAKAVAEYLSVNSYKPWAADLRQQYIDTFVAAGRAAACHWSFDMLAGIPQGVPQLTALCTYLLSTVAWRGGPVIEFLAVVGGGYVCDKLVTTVMSHTESGKDMNNLVDSIC